MGKLFIFTHGIGGSPSSVFIPQVRSELEKLGHKTHAPLYPDAQDPRYEPWKSLFDEDLSRMWNGTDDIILIGHSLGGYFVLRLLGDCSGSKWISSLKGVILVAPTAIKRPEYRVFYSEEIKWQEIRKLDVKIVNVWSRDDKNVPKEHQDLILSELGGMNGFEYNEVNGFGHFFQVEPQPPVVEAIMLFA